METETQKSTIIFPVSQSQKLVLEELYLENVTPESELLITMLSCFWQIYLQISIWMLLILITESFWKGILSSVIKS